VLTPLGEPLSTIAVVKLSGEPYCATFWYLLRHLGILISVGVVGCGLFGAFLLGRKTAYADQGESVREKGLGEVFVRTLKVYAFVAALFLLGAGMEVIIYKYFSKIPDYALFWFNMVSAILDNATLTAAEIAPIMTQGQINAALYGLLVSGGMLIPGNIPNIISAGKLGITSREWARLGVPLGLVLNVIFFVLVFVLKMNPQLPV
jgi:predicted cation transporter